MYFICYFFINNKVQKRFSIICFKISLQLARFIVPNKNSVELTITKRKTMSEIEFSYFILYRSNFFNV